MSGISLSKYHIRRSYYLFLNWWFSELAEFLPTRAKKFVAERRTNVCIDISGDQQATVSLSRMAGDPDRAAVINLAEDVSGKQSTIRDVIGNPGRIRNVMARLDQTMALQTVISLPLATVERLRDVLVFEMDKHTPFTSDQVYFGYEVIGRDMTRETIDVALYVILRRDLDHVIAKLEQCGLKPNAVEVASRATSTTDNNSYVQIILNPNDRRTRDRGRKSHVPLLILVNFVLLIALAMVLLQQKDAVVTDLAAQQDEIRVAADRGGAARKELDNYIEQSTFIVKKRHNEPSVVTLLNEVSKILPDGTWLKQFEYNNHQIKLQGESDKASALIGLLEASPFFSDTAFISPVTRNPRTETDMFLISAAVVTGKTKP